jgi:hypothetical protein
MSDTTRTDHAAAIKAKMNDLHQRGLMPGTETVDSISDAADALAAERDALLAYAKFKERQAEPTFPTLADDKQTREDRKRFNVAHIFDPEVAE